MNLISGDKNTKMFFEDIKKENQLSINFLKRIGYYKMK